jgi:hypothetical protein
MTKAAEASNQAVSPLFTALTGASVEDEELVAHKNDVEFSIGVQTKELWPLHILKSAAATKAMVAMIERWLVGECYGKEENCTNLCFPSFGLPIFLQILPEQARRGEYY